MRNPARFDLSTTALAALLTTLVVALSVGIASAPARATSPGPNGLIAFDSDRFGGTHNIFTMKSDGTDVLQLTFLTADEGAALGQRWSADGSTLTFEERNARGNKRQIWVMDADGSDQHKLFSDPWYVDFSPSFAPDGSKIVFARCTPDFEGCSIATVSADGTAGVTNLTDFSFFRFQPVYSPDGSQIAFSAFGQGGVTAAVWVMNADGSNVHQITAAPLSAQTGDWSPNGARILFWTHCCTPKNAQIWTINADGTDPVQLTNPFPKHDFTGTYSPNGRRIVFERDSADFSKFDIWVMNTDGSGKHKIQDDGFLPTWGPAPSP